MGGQNLEWSRAIKFDIGQGLIREFKGTVGPLLGYALDWVSFLLRYVFFVFFQKMYLTLISDLDWTDKPGLCPLKQTRKLTVITL